MKTRAEKLERAAERIRDQASKVLRDPAHVYHREDQGENPFALARYCGTLLAILEKDYCGTLGLSTLGAKTSQDQTVFEPQSEKPNEIMVAGPGFEPGTSRL